MSEHFLSQFFKFEHLPYRLQRVSEEFSVTARWIDEELRDGPEKDTCLRKLLEAKDCAVRAKLIDENP